MKKRILTMATILCLLITLFPVMAYAEGSSETIGPKISGIEDGKTYCREMTVTVTGDNIETVTLNGANITKTLDENNRFILSPAPGKQTIVVTDKAGNKAVMTVTINNGHQAGTEVRNDKDATCTEDGYTGDTYCKGCGEKLSAGTSITKLGHMDENEDHVCDVCGDCLTNKCVDLDKDHICDVETCKAKLSEHSGGTATCKDKAICDYCGQPYGEVNADNHTGGEEVRNAKSATCTEDGYTGDTYCKGCGDKLSNGTTIEATGHTDKNKDHICDVESCKAAISSHSGGTATCKDKAICDYCGQAYGEVNADNHTGGEEVRNAKSATCTEDGYTGDTYCKGCGDKLSAGTVISATGHDFGEDGKCKCGAVKFTVTFAPNGGRVDTETAITDMDGELDVLPTPTREGYVFNGWYTEKEGGTKVTTDTVYTAHTTLYAHWRKIVTRLDFSLSGYGYKKAFIDTTVTPGSGNEGVTYGDDYVGYGDYYGIVTDENSQEALSSGVFREEKDYFLYVTFFEADGYTLSDLKGGNIFLNGVPALAVVRKDKEMTAVFDLRTIYLIKATAGKNGEIDPEGTVAVFEGDDITFTITPDDGYLRSTVKVDGKKVKNAKTYTFEDVQESHTIQVTFVKSTNPKTGDDSGMQWVFHALTISAGALAALLLLRKKKKAI